MTNRRSLLIVGVAVPVVGVLVALVTGVVTGEQHWPGWLEILRQHPWPSIVVATIASVCLATLAAIPSAEPLELRSAADLLADAIGRDWSYEAEWRKIFDPYPLPVEWSAADSSLVVGWSALVRLAMSSPGGAKSRSNHWATGPQQLAGRGNDLVELIERVPTGRLVVLGEQGSGKTVFLMRLVLDLLSRRKPGEPVPVMIPLASWDPVEDDLRSWIVSWLITERAGLAGFAKAGTRDNLARALLDAGLILPVLDGLDEIPVEARASAISRINDYMRPGQRLILAARTSDYRAAVRPATGPEILLTGAAGIELSPLAGYVVAHYLRDSSGGIDAARRWDPISTAFADAHPPPVARVLTTPLMAALARVAYNPRPGERFEDIPAQPIELLDSRRFWTEKQIEDYLFDRFIPSSYREHPDPSHASRRYGWNSQQAERWLTFLAQDPESTNMGSIDLAWWRLPKAAPKHLVSVTLGLTTAVAGAFLWPYVGYGLGLIVAVIAGMAARRWIHSEKIGLNYGLIGGLMGGTAAALFALVILGAGERNSQLGSFLSGAIAFGIPATLMASFLPCFIAGFAAEFSVAFYEHGTIFDRVRTAVGPGSHVLNAIGVGLTAFLFAEMAIRSIPARGLRWSRAWLVCGLAAATIFGYITWVQAGWIIGITVGIAATLASVVVGGIAESVATDLAGAASPNNVLGRDRLTFFACWLGLGLSLAISAGLASAYTPVVDGRSPGLVYGAEIAAGNILAPGLIFGFIQAMWGPFTVTRWWLAARRHLPWRFMTFLHDAHTNRGVLRQVGAVYQFRHVELQRRLAVRNVSHSSDVRAFTTHNWSTTMSRLLEKSHLRTFLRDRSESTQP